MSQDGSPRLASPSSSSPRLFISAPAGQSPLQRSSCEAVGILFPISPWIMPRLSPPSRSSSLHLSPHPRTTPFSSVPPASLPFPVRTLCLVGLVSACSLMALPFLRSWQVFPTPFNRSLHRHLSLTRPFCLSSTQTAESVLRSLLPSGAPSHAEFPQFPVTASFAVPTVRQVSSPGFSSLHTPLKRTCLMPVQAGCWGRDRHTRHTRLGPHLQSAVR